MIVRNLGITDYQTTFESMKQFTAQRNSETEDELWVTQHRPVFTQGQAYKTEYILKQPHTPIVQSDRGGQITYHGPGQIITYILVDIKRANVGVRELVNLIEASLIETLSYFNIIAHAEPRAPGVYVNGVKIASIGLRIRKGCSYHGLALNVDMDLTPFTYIDPCGHQGLQMTQVSRLLDSYDYTEIEKRLCSVLTSKIHKYQRA